MKIAAVFTLLIASAAAFAPATNPTRAFSRGLALNGEEAKKGAGGMADTRDPETKEDKDDPRKSISAAPSFEEYMKQRDAGN
eukprot:CAMPEP_0118672154 /NCGR_PEP_ID=MMETSP0785-20121206/22385_1 /TAXON_ID=91992 /ORGANISM="Bolidomonas pacifica, Strain CCMP 1866" /LENGTH=81 /DNA_ID=CAMNT_0006567089 /DNA_START=18 /DNA_END=263 /DNA_ORIENTATION=-